MLPPGIPKTEDGDVAAPLATLHSVGPSGHVVLVVVGDDQEVDPPDSIDSRCCPGYQGRPVPLKLMACPQSTITRFVPAGPEIVSSAHWPWLTTKICRQPSCISMFMLAHGYFGIPSHRECLSVYVCAMRTAPRHQALAGLTRAGFVTMTFLTVSPPCPAGAAP